MVKARPKRAATPEPYGAAARRAGARHADEQHPRRASSGAQPVGDGGRDEDGVVDAELVDVAAASTSAAPSST